MAELDLTDLELEKADSYDLDGLDLEDAKPDLTVGRLAGRFGHTVKQFPGLVSKTYRSYLEAVEPEEMLEIADTPEEHAFLGDLYDTRFQAMDVPAKTRVQEKYTEYAEIFPEREAWKKAVVGELKDENKRLIERSREFEQYFEMPEEYKKSSGFLEDIAGGLGTSVASMGAAIAGSALGGPWTAGIFTMAAAYTQMHGYKVQELEEIGGVEAKDKLESALFSGAAQAPLEAISNLFMLSKVMKLNGTWTKFLVSTLQAGAGEGTTEFVQQFPDTYATIMALNPDLTTAEHLGFMQDNIGEITGEALYAGKVGAAAGMITVGAGGGGKIAIETMIDKLISPRQKAINEAKVARVEQLSGKFEKDGITESEAAELREMVNAPETTEIQDIVSAVKKQLVFQEPIKSDTRDEVLKSVKESGKFTEEQADSYAALWDGIARNWAELEPDRKPEQWYDEWLSEFNVGEFIETANKVYQTAAWHGGPHSFDKFSTEKIGTGEGAQAFGWGLYFTDEEGIARDYARQVKTDAQITGVTGKVKSWVRDAYWGSDTKDGAIKWLQGSLKNWEQAKKTVERSKNLKGTVDYASGIETIKEAINKIKSGEAKINRNLYKVTLHKDKKPGEYEWLEWDKKIDPSIGKKIIAQLSKEGIALDGINEKMVVPPDEFWMESRVTGKQIYQYLTRNIPAKSRNAKKEASLFLLRAGIDGIKYPTGTLSGIKDSDKFNYVVFDENTVTIEDKLTFQGQDKPRGAIENLFNGSPKIMHAFEAADPSTPIHETGHLLLEMMFQGGHEDYLIAAEWAGVDAATAMTGTKNWSTEQLEKFAKGFETYLMEGKAPTSRLASVFKKLKTWLLEIYKSVKALGVELDDNIREVFDRWVSTEFERENDPVRQVPEWLMADDIKTDMKRRELSEDESWDSIEAEAKKRVLGSLKEKRAKIEKELKKEFMKEARESVEENPIYDMLSDLRQRGGLKYEHILNDFGTGYVENIVKRLPGLVSKKGVPIDTFANEYGYDTADEMMQAILNAPTKQQAIQNYYDSMWSGYEMMQEYENLTSYEDVINEEIEILNAMLGKKPKARKDLKGIIKKQTGQIKDQEYKELKEGLKQDMRVARQAYNAGKKDAAIQQLEKTKQRIEALKTKIKDRDARHKLDKKMENIWKSKTLIPEYKAQITQILSQYYNIPKSYMIEPEMSLDAFLAEKQADNEVVVNAINYALQYMPEQKRNKIGYRIPLTLEEKQAMSQPVLMLNHMGRTENILLTEKEKANLDERVLELSTRGYEVFGQPEESDNVILLREKTSWFKNLSEKARTYVAMTGKLEFIFDVLDGGKPGPNAKLFEKSTDALDQELILGKEYLNKIQSVFSPVKKVKNWANKIHKIPGVSQSLTKEQMVMVALHSASESSRNALKTGNGFTDTQIDAIVQEIKNQGEWNLIEGVWGTFESLYPMLNEVHKTLTGVKLPRVEGKYFPLKYDSKLSRTAGMHEQRAAERDLFHDAYTRAHVEAGSRIARVAGKKPPVLLSLNVINMKLTEFIHDITHQLPVRDLQKVLSHERYRGMIDNTLGPEYYDQMMPWLAHIAKPKTEYSPGAAFVNKVRNNSTIVALGLKVTIGLKQVGSITQTVDELNLLTGSKTKGIWYTAKGTANFYRDRKQMVQFIKEVSPLMDNRKKNWNRELMEFYNATDVKNFGNSLEAKDAFFWIIQAVDQAVTFPTWYAGYLYGMDTTADHAQSVKIADKVVRKTQPVASPGDLSMFQRGGKKRSELLKWGTMFYTHFANFQNRMWQTKQLHKLGKIDMVEAYTSYWWILIAPGLLGGALGRREIPKGWDWLKDIIGYRLAGLPIIRDVAGPMITGYDYAMTPVERLFETPSRIVKIATSKGKDKVKKTFKEAARLAGYIFGLPTDQALITMEGIIDLMSGETNKPQRLFFKKPYKEKPTKRRSL